MRMSNADHFQKVGILNGGFADRPFFLFEQLPHRINMPQSIFRTRRYLLLSSGATDEQGGHEG